MRMALLCAVSLAAMAAPAAAVVTYKFTALSSFSSNVFGVDESFTGGFTITLPSVVTTPTAFPIASVESCTIQGSITGLVACNDPGFFFPSGLMGVSWGAGSTSFFYYFAPEAATTAGVWDSVLFGTDQQGRLETIITGTGAVPEPASWAMLIAGFGLVGAVRRRRAAARAA